MFIRRMAGRPLENQLNGLSELDWFRRDLDRLLNGTRNYEGSGASAGVFPLLNVTQDADNFYIRSEIPGMSLEELDVSVTGRNVSIAGERKIPVEDQKVRYHRREREAGRFRRQLNLPTDVQSEKVQAKYRHGMLMIVLPKAESAKPKKISISA